MEENRKGDLGEIKVQADLIDQGFNVSVPVHEIEYDLIAEREGDIYRVQVKTGTKRENRGSIQCQIVRSSRDYDSTKRKYDDDAFDILAMWCKPIDEVAYTDWSEAKTKYSVRESLHNIKPQTHHMVNLLSDQTITSAIERLK